MPPLVCLLTVLALLLAVAALDLSVNTDRLLSELHTMATHNDLSPPAVQRILYTPSDLSARAYLRSLLASASLTLRVDALGNQFGIWHGKANTQSQAVGTGSHIDAIPHSGMYDGVLGVLGAIEAVRTLQRAGFTPLRDVHVLAFTSEEPTRFGLGCLGSRVLSGALSGERAAALTDEAGVSVDAARTTAGFRGAVADVALPDDAYVAFIELHMEQADSLEQAQVDIGAVTAIAAPAQAEVSFTGGGGHAGALPMAARNDASLAAAEFALEVERAALDARSTYAVATTGRFHVFPGAVNSVPRVAELGVDVRDIDLARRDAVLMRVQEAATRISRNRGVDLEFNLTNADAPANCSERVVKTVERAAGESGLSVTRLVSRAYHDALFMARKFPTGMIFVPCRGGVSHRPDEFVAPKDIENGVLTLAKTIAALAGDASFDGARDEL